MSSQDGPGAERHCCHSSAEGSAALLLGESLVHVLIERAVLTVEEAMSAVQTALEVSRSLEEEQGADARAASTKLLLNILVSLAADQGGPDRVVVRGRWPDPQNDG